MAIYHKDGVFNQSVTHDKNFVRVLFIVLQSSMMLRRYFFFFLSLLLQICYSCYKIGVNYSHCLANVDSKRGLSGFPDRQVWQKKKLLRFRILRTLFSD